MIQAKYIFSHEMRPTIITKSISYKCNSTGLGRYEFNFGAIFETMPSSDACSLEMNTYGLFEYILLISNFTSLILLLLFYLLYQHLLIVYPFVPYGNIFFAILIKRRPHTSFSASFLDVNHHDFY